jgi:hypothetical protein
MIDLFEIANANAESVSSRFAALLGGLPAEKADRITRFAEWITANARMGLNIRLLVVAEMVNGKPHQNIHEWAREQANLSGRSAEDILRERLGAYYEARTNFDNSVTYGHELRYAALVVAGLGLTRYAPYCIVLTTEYQSSLQHVACIIGDSLTVCCDKAGRFDENALRDRATSFALRDKIAAEHFGERIPSDEGEWNSLLASDEYVEVIFRAELNINDVALVRTSKDEYDRMWSLAFENFRTKLDDAERSLVQDFVILRRAVVDGRITLEVLTL